MTSKLDMSSVIDILLIHGDQGMLIRNCEMPYSAADRRFVARCRKWIGAVLIVYLSLNTMLQLGYTANHPGVFGGASGAAFFGLLLLTGLSLSRSGDEFRRLLLLRSLLAGLVVTMCPVCIWGFAEIFSHGVLPHLPLLAIPTLLVISTAAFKLLIFRRYAAPSEEQTS